jgi:hypothetical protein
MPPFSLLLNYNLKNDGFDIVIAESAAAGFAELEDAVSDVLISRHQHGRKLRLRRL